MNFSSHFSVRSRFTYNILIVLAVHPMMVPPPADGPGHCPDQSISLGCTSPRDDSQQRVYEDEKTCDKEPDGNGLDLLSTLCSSRFEPLQYNSHCHIIINHKNREALMRFLAVITDTEPSSSEATIKQKSKVPAGKKPPSKPSVCKKKAAKKKTAGGIFPKPRARGIQRYMYLSSFNLFTHTFAVKYRSLTHVEEEKRLDMALKDLEDMTRKDRLEHASALCMMTPQEIKNRKKKGEGLQFKAMGQLGRRAWANLSLEEKQRYKDAVQAAKNSIRDESG